MGKRISLEEEQYIYGSGEILKIQRMERLASRWLLTS